MVSEKRCFAEFVGAVRVELPAVLFMTTIRFEGRELVSPEKLAFPWIRRFLLPAVAARLPLVTKRPAMVLVESTVRTAPLRISTVSPAPGVPDGLQDAVVHAPLVLS
jgi:hypothetical protein